MYLIHKMQSVSHEPLSVVFFCAQLNFLFRFFFNFFPPFTNKFIYNGECDLFYIYFFKLNSLIFFSTS
jgi:hypothetical protein